jgi:hypothetical protein
LSRCNRLRCSRSIFVGHLSRIPGHRSAELAPAKYSPAATRARIGRPENAPSVLLFHSLVFKKIAVSLLSCARVTRGDGLKKIRRAVQALRRAFALFRYECPKSI